MPSVRWQRRSAGAPIRWLALLALPAALLLAGDRARAQAGSALPRPSEERPELPELGEPEPRERILPRIELPREEGTEGLAAGRRVLVRDFRIVGNTVLPADRVDAIVSPYRGRELGWADLEQLRLALTHELIERGYVTSGALVPSQSVSDGIVEIRIVEGRLEQLQLDSDGRLPEARIRERLAERIAGPVNVARIEEQLQILQQNPRVERVDAELGPGSERGLSTLRVEIAEARAWDVLAGYANDKNSTIGEHRGYAQLRHWNIAGFEDTGILRASVGETFRDVELRYDLPTGLLDTTIGAFGRYTESGVIEAAFEPFDIESRSQGYGLRLARPLRQTGRSRLSAELIAEWRRSETFALGEPFSFSEGATDGESTVAVLRAGLDWIQRGRDRVWAARSLLTFGLDVLGATHDTGGVADGQYIAWLGQAQVAQRLPLDAQLLGRLDLQLTNAALLGLEQIGIGGSATVRGYRENEIVADNGVVASLELRLPVYRSPARAVRVELAPFVDLGHAWNERSPAPVGPTIVGVGVGGRLHWTRGLSLAAYWGHDAISIDRSFDDSVQGSGVHLRAEVRWP